MYGIAGGMFLVAVLLRVGLLACIVMFFGSGMLVRTPVTVNVDAWYAGTSAVALVVFVALALYGFIISLAGRPLFSVSA
jgi:hypothetical protein